jgi:predicted component of type VI protein secretion system
MQYHDIMNGTETWLDHIRSVKEAHPNEWYRDMARPKEGE